MNAHERNVSSIRAIHRLRTTVKHAQKAPTDCASRSAIPSTVKPSYNRQLDHNNEKNRLALTEGPTEFTYQHPNEIMHKLGIIPYEYHHQPTAVQELPSNDCLVLQVCLHLKLESLQDFIAYGQLTFNNEMHFCTWNDIRVYYGVEFSCSSNA